MAPGVCKQIKRELSRPPSVDGIAREHSGECCSVVRRNTSTSPVHVTCMSHLEHDRHILYSSPQVRGGGVKRPGKEGNVGVVPVGEGIAPAGAQRRERKEKGRGLDMQMAEGKRRHYEGAV